MGIVNGDDIMSEKKVIIEIIGQDAEDCANELSGIINAEFGSQPEKFHPQDQHAHEGAGEKLDPSIIGAIAGTISAGLAFPVAILAGIQIKDRLGKKESFERLIERGRELKKTKRISKIRFRIGPIECEIERASFAEISDLAS
jgi:hypothetical protein